MALYTTRLRPQLRMELPMGDGWLMGVQKVVRFTSSLSHPTTTSNISSRRKTTAPINLCGRRTERSYFIIPTRGRFAVIGITTEPVFMFGKSTALPRRFLAASTLARRPYDITPKGKFVSTIQPGLTASAQTDGTQIELVLNWFED